MAGACGKILTLWLLLAVCALVGRAQGCQEGAAYSIMQAGNATATFKATGTFWPYFMQGNETEYLFEANDSVGTMIFTGGLWMSGKTSLGVIRAAATYYDPQGWIDYHPGPMGKSGPPTQLQCSNWDRFFQCSRQDVEIHRQLAHQHTTAEGTEIPLNLIPGTIRNWPGAGNPFFTAKDGSLFDLDTSRIWAPFVDADQDGIYDPTRGDYPMVRGDQNTWWIFNDAGGPNPVGKSEPLGIQVSVLAYSFSVPGPPGDATYYDVTILSPFALYDSFYFGLHVDFDLGWTFDDYHSCDTGRHMGIGLNGQRVDHYFGPNPPQLGVRLLETPHDITGKMIGMTAFRPASKGFGPISRPFYSSLEFWNYMQGKWLDGTWQTYGGNGYSGTGPPFPWFFPDDPEDTTGWSECNSNRSPSDRQMLICSGPYHLEAGKPLSFTFAVISAACTGTWDGKCHRRHCIQQASDEVHDFFKAQRPVGIDLPQQPLTRQLKLYPNPASGHFSLGMSEGNQQRVVSVDLFDIRGAMVRQWLSPVPEAVFPLTGLPHGPYFVAVGFSNGERATGVLVVSWAD